MLRALTHLVRDHKPTQFNRTSRRPMSTSGSASVSTQPYVKLHNGLLMPQLGLGTWEAPQEQVIDAIKSALRTGYRHFDCAAIYGNERAVGIGLKEGMEELGLKRSDIWVTSKLWNTSHRPDLVRHACDQTLHDLGMDYLDLYLMHWPVDQLPEEGPKVGGDPTATETPLWETYDAMQELVAENLTRAIGVSNFSVRELEELIKDTDLVPTVNQIEMHPYLVQPKLMEYCASKGIVIAAYSPLGRNKQPRNTTTPPLMQNPLLATLSKKYSKSPAQIAIRWSLQHENVVLPKSTNAGRIKENWDVFDFVLTQEEMKQLDALNFGYRFVTPSFHTFAEDKGENDGKL